MARQSDQIKYRRTFGIFALALLLLVVSASLVFGAEKSKNAPEPLQLRSSIVVDGEQITFDDVFANAGDISGKFIAASPRPGRKLALSPEGIAQLAATNGRSWRNISGLQRVVIKRSGRRLSQQELSELIEDELAQTGVSGKYELLISTGSAGIYVPNTGTSMPMIEKLNFDPKTGRFVASLIPHTGASQVILRGRAWATTKVPTLNRIVHSGDLILAEDVVWNHVRTARLGLYPVLSPENMIGKIAARTLQPNKVLRLRDLQIPHAVLKGEMITISYQMPGLRLTARGKVLANAGTGEMVRAVNLSSSRTIDVTITGPGHAVAVATHNLGG